LSSRLAQIGYELVVLTNEVDAHADEPHEFELIVEPFRLSTYSKTIRRLSPSVVIFFLHARDMIVWPLLLLLKLSDTKVIYWNHGINLQTPDDRIKRMVFGLFHRFADAILLYSKNEVKYIKEKFRDKVFIANNTINFGVMPEVHESKARIRDDFGIQFDKVVLFVGRITPEKNLSDLLAAGRFLDPGVGIVVVGDGLSEELRDQVVAAGNIKYLGGIYDPERINRVFKMSDVFSIPGKVGLGVNQAFFWGLPIVTEDVRHSPEIVYVRDGVNGFIVDKGDFRALAEKINFLLSSDDRYRQFSSAARTEILEQGNIDRMCDGFVEAIGYVDGKSCSLSGHEAT
jgi:glycosyltransferase involved in cell wall biosynthesis